MPDAEVSINPEKVSSPTLQMLRFRRPDNLT
jgi:hypothetical protein